MNEESDFYYPKDKELGEVRRNNREKNKQAMKCLEDVIRRHILQNTISEIFGKVIFCFSDENFKILIFDSHQDAGNYMCKRMKELNKRSYGGNFKDVDLEAINNIKHTFDMLYNF